MREEGPSRWHDGSSESIKGGTLPLSSLAVAALALQLVFTGPAHSNDTSAQLSVGGLTFARTDAISIESEHLTISPRVVNVRYRFRNLTAKDITLTVAFPLPDRNLAEERGQDTAIPLPDSPNFVGFETLVEGSPVQLTIEQRAFVKESDITEELQRHRLPLLPGPDFSRHLTKLAPADRAQLTERGVIEDYEPMWTVRTRFMRQQTFPAGRIVNVEHRYRTSLGGSASTGLLRGTRKDTLDFYRRNYCVDDGFLSAIDRAARRHGEDELSEWFMTYVLSTGANWAGPIRDFVLVVDKGNPDALVSFCGENVRRISATTFSMSKKNFTPTGDLNVLIVGPRNKSPAGG